MSERMMKFIFRLKKYNGVRLNLWFGISVVLLVIFCSGCTSFKEGLRVVLGVSTKELEEKRGLGIKRIFDLKYEELFTKTKAILKQGGSYIYAEDPSAGLIAIYVSSEDTTAVGIFLYKKGEGKTEIEVVSASSFAKEAIAQRLFLALEKTSPD